ncbi:MAG: hypothetical protein E7C63_07625 [Finegoldia magna]|uniref:hypothetical protein n=1 Tax=Finegoldia TaxID=150022 RepID=UPI0012B0ED9A|nr:MULTISPECIES: hypothetical protein [Finegoldia]MBS5777271.1 hypothetical protein [Finegoldia magna]MDU2640111.1 hypothetical protein [Finegoldia magna]MDU6880291.1 hypothetical protein [Finegoldia magna]MSB11288.1 hypothetical protein [Finegoldia sp. BIOML-A1]
MKNIKKFGLLLALVASVSLSSCSSEQSLNKPDTTTSTAENNKKDTAADTQENKKEDKENKEDKKPEETTEATEKDETKKDNQQELTDDEKATLDEFVERLEKYENGTAGASLKMDRLFTEMVNRCTSLETKPEKSQEYLIKKVSQVKDTENFKQSVKGLKDTIEYYKSNKQQYIQELKDSGATWDPQIKLESLENVVNKF